jgi:2-polyprenyl-3-methyl-5-hydroxy-6-metoxy-1,4-benzoquinol methylase
MKNLLFLFLAILLFNCQEKNDSKKGHIKHHKSNEVNEHMHKTPVSDLIKRFESPERNVYQKPEKVLDYIGDVKGLKILDIGAGSGIFILNKD